MPRITKPSWAPASVDLMFRLFLLLHFLLVVFIVFSFSFSFSLTLSASFEFIARHFALHRSWLHVLVGLLPRSVYFFSPFSFMYRYYTAMITQAPSHFHSCTSHHIKRLTLRLSLYFFTSISQRPADLYVFQYHQSLTANMNAVLSQHIHGLFPRLLFTFPSHTVDTGWPSLYGIFNTKSCSSNTYLRPRMPRVIHCQQFSFFILRDPSRFRLSLQE